MNTLEKTEQIINKVLEDPMHFLGSTICYGNLFVCVSYVERNY